MHVVRLSGPSDPRLSDFRDLRDVQLRTVKEPAEGIFIAEGEKTIRRALAAGYALRSLLCSERWLEPLASDLEASDAAAFVAGEDVVASITGFHVHRGALASFERKPLPPAGQVVAAAERIVVLEDLSDHTNVGAIFRSAAALAWDAVLITPRCADPLYRRAIRTSMGAVFAIPWTRLPHREGPGILEDAGFRLVALTPAADAEPIRSYRAEGKLALALGAEGPGLSQRWLDRASVRLRIPMREGIDSLNVAAAAAIALHQLGPG